MWLCKEQVIFFSEIEVMWSLIFLIWKQKYIYVFLFVFVFVEKKIAYSFGPAWGCKNNDLNLNFCKKINLLTMYSLSGHPRCRWACFFIWTNLEKLQYITCSPMAHLKWMGAVRMRVQTADKNITIIHTTPIHQLMSCEICFYQLFGCSIWRHPLQRIKISPNLFWVRNFWVNYSYKSHKHLCLCKTAAHSCTDLIALCFIKGL